MRLPFRTGKARIERLESARYHTRHWQNVIVETNHQRQTIRENLHFDKRSRTASREGRYDLTERKPYVVDNICDLAGALAAWTGQLLHAGRIHSHPARDCDCGADHSVAFRSPAFVTSAS